MARPEKQWLDYFSMDVEKDNKLKFLKAKFWTLGFWMYVELLQFIYKEWYFINRDDDTMLLFMSETGLKEEEIELMLEFMLLKWLFNKVLYDKYKILTSNWIQKRYSEGTKKRKNTVVDTRFWCVWEYEHIELMDTLIELKEELTELLPTESTQRKGKESKVNKSKEKFDEFWKLYPNKKWKAKAEEWYLKNITEEIHSNIMFWVQAYIDDCESKRKKKEFVPEYKHWSTFLNQKSRQDYEAIKEDDAWQEAYSKDDAKIYANWCKKNFWEERSLLEYGVKYSELKKEIIEKKWEEVF